MKGPYESKHYARRKMPQGMSPQDQSFWSKRQFLEGNFIGKVKKMLQAFINNTGKAHWRAQITVADDWKGEGRFV